MPSVKQHFITRRKFVKCSTAATAGAAFATGIKLISPAIIKAQERSGGWHESIYRLLHLDAHFGGFKEIYRDFDAEAAARIIDEACFQMVSFMAQDGPSYYPTKIGRMHPGLDRDFVGEFTRALQKRGILAIVYFGLGQGCYNSPHVDEVVIPQYKEILEMYDVDGFFPDGVLQPHLMQTCRCKYCRELFARDVGGEIPKDDSDPMAFAYRKWSNRRMEAFMEKVYHALSAIKPEIAILNNHLWVTRYPVTPPPYVKHICWDTPVPDQGLYSWNFSFEARYLSTLQDVLPNITWSCMNTRGHNWMEYSLREPEAFFSECAILLAAGGRTYLSDIPYPHGNPDPAVMEIFSAVNKRTIELEPFLKGCKPVKDVAVLHAEDSVWSKTPMIPHATWTPSKAYHSVCGTHKALIEGHVQMSIFNNRIFQETLNEYRALILPDQCILSESECDEIRNFVRNGGALIATGETATRDTENNLLKNFPIADVLGVDYLGSSDTANSYLRVNSKNTQYGIPAMDVQVMGKYVRIKTTTAQVLLELVPPYEGIKTGTPPPALTSEGPGLTINSYGKGKVVYCASPLFTAYYTKNTPVLRKLALWMLDQIYPNESRPIILENTPINVEIFYNRRNNERFIHLVNYSGDKREVGTSQVQDFTTVHGIRIRVKLSVKPKRVTAVPGGDTIPFTYRSGWASFDAKPLNIHAVYRIEI